MNKSRKPNNSILAPLNLKTWERCARCNMFITFTGFEWTHRTGKVHCIGGNAVPKDNDRHGK